MTETKSHTAYERRKAALIRQVQRRRDQPIGLNKRTSNLYRDRAEGQKARLDVSGFHHVLDVGPKKGWVEVEGMATFEEFADGTLPHGVMPSVVPQLKTITIGGAATGLGIESTSFRHGLVHDGVLGMDILLPSGEVVWATAENTYRDLFKGFPNSFGTLGYALKLRVKTLPVKPYVELCHIRHTDPAAYCADIERLAASDIDFLDGSVFTPHELYITTGRFVDEVPWVSDYTFEEVYYQSIRRRCRDYLTVRDYLWRWDTDWFWGSKNVGAQNWLLRRFLYGSARLGSATYTKLMRWNAKHNLMGTINHLLGVRTESVIQDVDIPIERCPEFIPFLLETIKIHPVWVCPIAPQARSEQATLYPMKPNTLHVNFGFWNTLRRHDNHPAANYLNRLVEKKVAETGGMKSLYSSAYYAEDEFWKIYNGPEYKKLKAKYDPDGRLKSLYEKVVLRG